MREAFARDFGVRGYADWKELLAAEEIDLAYIFLPHDECPAAAVACAERKIHVVVEKPVANTARAPARSSRRAAATTVLFSTPYVWRYHPVCREMKKIVDSGVLGRIVGCEGRCAAGGLHRYIDGHASWMLHREKSGGGPMYNLGVHWIDLYRWLLGSEVTAVIGKNVHVNQNVRHRGQFLRDLHVRQRGDAGAGHQLHGAGQLSLRARPVPGDSRHRGVPELRAGLRGHAADALRVQQRPAVRRGAAQDDPIRVGEHAGLQRLARPGVRGRDRRRRPQPPAAA